MLAVKDSKVAKKWQAVGGRASFNVGGPAAGGTTEASGGKASFFNVGGEAAKETTEESTRAVAANTAPGASVDLPDRGDV